MRPSSETLDAVGKFPRAGSVPASAAQRVYELLRNRILSLELPPDTTLSRNELARDYDVSQTPLREAMQRLEQDGLIRIYPQSKTVVTRINVPQIYESHFLRVAVECELVRRLAEKPTPGLITRTRALLKMQAALVENVEEASLFNDLDEAFHRTLYEAAGQDGLFDLIRSRSGHLARARRLDLPHEGKMRAILEMHTEIIDAIEALNPERAQDAMRKHLTGTVLRIDAISEKYPDYFRN